MRKPTAYIVLNRKLVVNPYTKKQEEEETVEFVKQLTRRHIQTAVRIGDYVNSKLIGGTDMGTNTYEYFETYVRSKYEKEMQQLDAIFNKTVDAAKVESEKNNAEINTI